MASPEDTEGSSASSISLLLACDWTAPRSWLVLLGTSLGLGAACAILVGTVSIFGHGSPAAPIETDTLLLVTKLAVGFLLLAALMAAWVTKAASRVAEPQSLASRKSARRTELLGDLAILSILEAALVLPFIPVGILFIGENETAKWIWALALILALGVGPELVRACLERWCPQFRHPAD